MVLSYSCRVTCSYEKFFISKGSLRQALGGLVDKGVDISSISMVEANVLSILAKSDFEFNGQFEVCEEKKLW
jgi:hypothetical protein